MKESSVNIEEMYKSADAAVSEEWTESKKPDFTVLCKPSRLLSSYANTHGGGVILKNSSHFSNIEENTRDETGNWAFRQ